MQGRMLRWKKASGGNCQNKENTWVIQQYKVYGNEVFPRRSQSFLLVFSSARVPGSVVQCIFPARLKAIQLLHIQSKHKASVKADDPTPKFINSGLDSDEDKGEADCSHTRWTNGLMNMKRSVFVQCPASPVSRFPNSRCDPGSSAHTPGWEMHLLVLISHPDVHLCALVMFCITDSCSPCRCYICRFYFCKRCSESAWRKIALLCEWETNKVLGPSHETLFQPVSSGCRSCSCTGRGDGEGRSGVFNISRCLKK